MNRGPEMFSGKYIGLTLMSSQTRTFASPELLTINSPSTKVGVALESLTARMRKPLNFSGVVGFTDPSVTGSGNKKPIYISPKRSLLSGNITRGVRIFEIYSKFVICYSIINIRYFLSALHIRYTLFHIRFEGIAIFLLLELSALRTRSRWSHF